MAESQSNPGKFQDMVEWRRALVEESDHLQKVLDEASAKAQAELALERHRAELQQVLEGSMLQEYGPEKWRLCGTGASSEEPEFELEAGPNALARKNNATS